MPRAALRAVVVADQSFGGVASAGRRSADVDLLPDAERLLVRLAAAGADVAIVLPEGLPKATQLNLPIDAKVVPARRTPARTLAACAQGLGPLEGALLVGADRVLRGAGVDAGCRAAAHPSLAMLLLEGVDPAFVRVTGGRPAIDRLEGLIPYWLEHGDEAWTALGAGPPDLAVAAVRAGLSVDVLALNLAVEDPLIVRFDAGTPRGRVVGSGDGWALYALGPEDIADSLPAHGAHGHFVALAPNAALATRPPAEGWRAAETLLSRWPKDLLGVESTGQLVPLPFGCSGTAATFGGDVNRYAGGAPLNGGAPISSRHSTHPDNARVVQSLLDDLRSIGYCATTHAFSYGGRTLYNVIADLPGAGYFRPPKAIEQLRDLLRQWPPDPPWEGIRELLGDSYGDELGLDTLPAWEARRLLLEAAGLKPWILWRLRRCPLPGPGAELVLVGCHLDSSAARDPGYNPASDAARGADDDGSGIALVLAAARDLWPQRGRLRHTVRFCFFNAEESGLVGSQAYAAMLRAWSAPIRAVVCADMVGFNTDANRVFEIHAGANDPAIRDASVPIAQCIASWAAALGALGPAQLYRDQRRRRVGPARVRRRHRSQRSRFVSAAGVPRGGGLGRLLREPAGRAHRRQQPELPPSCRHRRRRGVWLRHRLCGHTRGAGAGDLAPTRSRDRQRRDKISHERRRAQPELVGETSLVTPVLTQGVGLVPLRQIRMDQCSLCTLA